MANLTACFVDLVSFRDEDRNMTMTQLNEANDPFCSSEPKNEWYTTMPIRLFQQGNDFEISRTGDYLRSLNVKAVIPKVELKCKNSLKRLRWTRNLMHNLVRKLTLDANGMLLTEMDSIALDHVNKYIRPEEYYRMIGNIPELINPTSIHPQEGVGLPRNTLWLPLPIQTNMGCILPTAITYHNIIRLHLEIRPWTQLLILDDFEAGISRPAKIEDLIEEPQITFEVIAEYAMVSEQRRKLLMNQDKSRLDFIMNMCETMLVDPTPNQSININPTGSVKTFYFGVKNISNPAEHSNYSTLSPLLKTVKCGGKILPDGVDFYPNITAVQIRHSLISKLNKKLLPDLVKIVDSYIDFEPCTAKDPLLAFRLFYGPSCRLDVDIQFYSTIHPLSVGGKIPNELGYHMYNYGESLTGTGGRTNYDDINPYIRLDYDKEVIEAPHHFQFFQSFCSCVPMALRGGALYKRYV